MSLGTAAVEVVADTSGFEAGLKSKVGTAVKVVGGLALGVAAVGTAVAGLALKGGLDRALNIEDAQAKLRGLGHDTKAIETIMDSALASVRGTAFGLDAAATAAASAVAAGIAPGEELTRVLGLTGDAATIMGRSFGESGAIINKVLASNRLSMQEVNQLHQAGLPILSMLADQYGVTAEEMRKMISDGVVGSEEFLRAIETNIGGAALESGNTVRGAAANMGAALSRLGEKVVGPLLPVFTKVFGGLTEILDNLTVVVGEKVVPVIQRFVDAFMDGEGLFDSFVKGIDALAPRLGQLLLVFQEGEGAADKFGGVIASLGMRISKSMGTILPAILGAVQNAIASVVQWLASGGITQILNTLLDARSRLLDAAMQLFPVILTALIEFLPELLGFITGELIPAVIELVVTAVPLLLDAAVALFEALVEAVTVILPELLGVLLGEVLPNLLDTIANMYPQLVSTNIALFQALIDAIVVILPKLVSLLLGTLLPKVLSTLASMIPELLRAAVAAFTTLIEAVTTILPQLVNILLVEVLPTLITTLVDMIPELLAAAIETFLALVDAVIEVLPMLIGVIITEVVPGVVNAVITLGPLLLDAGKNVMTQLWNGIKEVGKKVVQWVKDEVVGAIKNLWPFSPAKEGPFAGRGSPLFAGRNIAAMLGEGIAQMTPSVVAAAEDLTRAAARVLNDVDIAAPSVARTGALSAASGQSGTVTVDVGGIKVEITGDISRMQARQLGEDLGEGILEKLSRARVVR